MKATATNVHATLAKHYPAHVLGWVKRAAWKHDPAVPLARIDMARRPGARDPEKVAGIADAVKSGKPMPPVVLVDTGEPKLAIADGYHRTLGFLHAGKRAIPAVIATGAGKRGPWEKRMHAAKLNLTAEHAHTVDLAGVCTGPGPCDTTPLGTGKNWLRKVNGLPPYIRAIAHSLRRDHGMDESRAIATAVATVKRWAAGGGGVTPATRVRAAAAVAEWEAKKAASHALTAAPSRTVDLSAAPDHVYHWRHGWIPITPEAALSKAHGSHAGAARILHSNGQHEDAQRMLARGVRVSAPGSAARERYRKALADHMAKHGTLIGPNAKPHSTPASSTSSEHFRMSGPELRTRAAAGDTAAQAEIDRRAARKAAAGGKAGGHREGVPFKPATTAEKPPAAPAPEVPKQPVPTLSRPLTPEGAYMRDRGTMTPSERVAKARDLFGADSEEYKNAVSAENAHIEEQLTRFPSAGPGHTIRSAVQSRYQRALAGTMESKSFATLHRHEIANPNGSSYPLTIGRVQERHDQPGVFHAEHATYKLRGRTARSEYHDLGTFDTREKAHKAIAIAEAQHHNAQLDKRIKEAATAQRKANAAQGVTGPNGTKWAAINPSELLAAGVGEDLKRGRTADQVAAKARQSFKAGNYTVTVEANLSAERTKQLLRDITTAVDETPLRGHEVHFVVPTGHSGFKGGAGGFVYAGGRTVYLSPTLVSGAKTHLFTQGDATDFHMPASGALGRDSNVSVIVHELGHVHDNILKHTRGGGESVFYPSGGGFSGTPSRFHGEMAPKMTRYARKNPSEGYAEAFMQYHVGGHGSHPAADAYAARYGWHRTTGIAAKRG